MHAWRSDSVVCQASSHSNDSRRSSSTTTRAWGSSAGRAAVHAATTSATPAGGAGPPAPSSPPCRSSIRFYAFGRNGLKTLQRGYPESQAWHYIVVATTTETPTGKIGPPALTFITVVVSILRYVFFLSLF